MIPAGHRFALVLSGGNALGAYQGGACQALHEHGLEPEWVAGASAGALNAAIFCGNPPDRRISRLREFWSIGDGHSVPAPEWPQLETMRRTNAVIMTLLGGHPGAFVPRNLLGPWWNPFGNAEPSSLYDTAPLAATLRQLVDFPLLNRGPPRFFATGVDVETGEDIVFDSRRHVIDADHIRASCALMPAFPPVSIEGRLVADPGLSVNLPLDAILAEARPGGAPLLCIALDLLPRYGARPSGLGGSILRMQDLMFATQSRRSIAAWQAIFEQREMLPAVTLLHLAYSGQQREVSGKAFDFSTRSARSRWDAGHRDMTRVLDQLGSGAFQIGSAGLTIYSASADQGQPRASRPVRWPVGPVPA